MRDVIARVVDGSRFREFKKEYGTTMITVGHISFNSSSIKIDVACIRVLHTSMDFPLGLLPTMESSSPHPH
jgi:hypothetical protein